MFKEILETLDKVIPQWAVYVVSTFIFILYGFFYVISRLGVRDTTKLWHIIFKKKVKLDKNRLKHHEFLEHMRFLMEYQIRNMGSDDVRCEIMRDFVRTYVEAMYDHHVNLLEEDIKDMNKATLKDALKNTLFKAIEEHENNFILMQETREEKNTAGRIVRRFNEAHNNNFVIGSIEVIDSLLENDSIVKTNYEMVYNIFNMHHSIMLALILKAEEVFMALNGRLLGLKYNEQIIDKITHNKDGTDSV